MEIYSTVMTIAYISGLSLEASFLLGPLIIAMLDRRKEEDVKSKTGSHA